MELKEKYYIPEIEEFHVGFEYEKLQPTVKYDPKWRFEIKRTVFTSKIWTVTGSNYNWEQDLIEQKIRVKYLDKDDIESLGFKYIGGKMVRGVRDEFKIEEYRIHLIHSYGAGSTEIIYNPNDDNEMTVFYGNIKNKSELKSIIKKLNIIQWI